MAAKTASRTDFVDRAEDFKVLAVCFESTAARLTAVHHKLI
jgi:hypothetical protein